MTLSETDLRIIKAAVAALDIAQDPELKALKASALAFAQQAKHMLSAKPDGTTWSDAEIRAEADAARAIDDQVIATAKHELGEA